MDATVRDSGAPAILTALEITPGDSTIISVNGAPATVDLELEAVYDDGSRQILSSAFWTVDTNRVATIDASTGVVTADGALAGAVTVTAEALSMTATTSVTVEVERVVIGEGVAPDTPTTFADAVPMMDDARRANLLYPLDGTVFPQNIYPPDVQWERGAAGDLYHVTIRGSLVSVDAYVAHDGLYHWLVDRDAWRAVAESTPETPVTLRVDRLEGSTGELITGTELTFRFADAVIRGALYYWSLNAGQIWRIRGDGTGRENAIPFPPQRTDYESGAEPSRCIACHTVSRDGRRLSAELWGGAQYGAVFDLTADLSGDPAPTVVEPNAQRFLTASFNPDASLLVANNGNELFLMDGNTGARVAAEGTPLPTTGSAHPAWSPDGESIAYVSNTNGTWGVDFTRGDLSLIDVTPPRTLSAARTLLVGGERVVARPSWSPDSAWIGFQYGTNSRSGNNGAGVENYPGHVRMVSRDGATSYHLEALDGGGDNSYYPTFSPYDEGGYYWLAFFSPRNYGNTQVGNRRDTGNARRQLWVSAVSSRPTEGVDPSSVPYWLPQQDVDTDNMAAYWTEEPCFAEGRSCSTSGECCSGFCRDSGDGAICVPPDEVECSLRGEGCRTDDDCCEGAGRCLGNVCSDLE